MNKQTGETTKYHSWQSAFKGYLKPRIAIFSLLGFSCGLPFGLIGFALALWLTASNIEKAVIGFFALVLLPYNFKFLWAPLVDRVRLPFLANRFGAKKAWLMCFQVGLIFSVWGLASHAPDTNSWFLPWSFSGEGGKEVQTAIPMQTYLFAFLTAFFAASQDIVVDALRINTLAKEEYGEGTSMYQFGYRMGMLISSAGVVAMAGRISWSTAYFCVGCLIFVGLCATFFVRESVDAEIEKPRGRQFWHEMVIAPFQSFMTHAHWYLILVFIVLYKLCNAVLGRMALPFYKDMGFSDDEIALVSGTIGPWVTIGGVAVGGVLVMRYPILKLLFALGCVEILTSVVFGVFSLFPHSIPMFLVVILFDNIIGGMGGAVFAAYLSGLCIRKYAATQYALLSSLMMFSVSVISVYSGIWATQMGWMKFFFFTGILMLPALSLLFWLMRMDKIYLFKTEKK